MAFKEIHYVKLIDDFEIIKNVQKEKNFPSIDFQKYHNEIGQIYTHCNDHLVVQFHVENNTKHIKIHKSLLIEAPEKATESQNPIFQNEPSLKEIILSIKNPEINDITEECVGNDHVHEKDERNQTALHCASYYGTPAKISTLIECKCDLLDVDIEGDTVLHFAIYSENIDNAKLLIKKKSQLLRIKNLKDETPLLLATKKNLTEMFIILWNGDKSLINDQDKKGNAPIHYIVRNKNLELLKLVISYSNLQLNIFNKEGISPYGIACHYVCKEVIEILVKRAKAKKDLTFLFQVMKNVTGPQLLIEKHHYDLAFWLVEFYPIKWSEKYLNSSKESVLHTSVSHKRIDIVKYLVEKDPNLIEIRDKNGRTALDISLELYEKDELDNRKACEIAILLINKNARHILQHNKPIYNKLQNNEFLSNQQKI